MLSMYNIYCSVILYITISSNNLIFVSQIIHYIDENFINLLEDDYKFFRKKEDVKNIKTNE